MLGRARLANALVHPVQAAVAGRGQRGRGRVSPWPVLYSAWMLPTKPSDSSLMWASPEGPPFSPTWGQPPAVFQHDQVVLEERRELQKLCLKVAHDRTPGTCPGRLAHQHTSSARR